MKDMDVEASDGAAKAVPVAPAKKSPLWRSLFFQLIIAVIIGIFIGHYFPDVGTALKPLGDGFIRLIQMIITPLVFLVLVTGIAAVGDVHTMGNIGVKALVYFLVMTTFALIFGLVVGNVVQPGAGMSIDPYSFSTHDLDDVVGKVRTGTEFVLDIIPSSVVGAFADNSLLQVLFFAIFFGAGIIVVGPERCAPLLVIFDRSLEVVFKITSWIMLAAPIGALGAMAYIISLYGIGTLGTFAKLIAACYGAGAAFIVLLFAISHFLAKVPLGVFIRYTKEEFILALGTASSEAVMPRIMNKLTRAGCSRAVTGLVIPTGYSFNLEGASIYLSIALLFLAQAFNYDLDFSQQLAALGVLFLTSKVMAGVPGSSFLALSVTAAALGLFPVAGVALLLGADRIMDSMRVTVNLLGNCVAAFVVARWADQLNYYQMRHAFEGNSDFGPEKGVPLRFREE